MSTKKYFAYNPESEGPFDGHMMHATWGGAAAEAMRYDGYAFSCREIVADDLPIIYNVIDSEGRVVDWFREHADAIAWAGSCAEDGGESHTVAQAADESKYSIGDFGLWVRSRSGDNLYLPAGVDHRDFTRITGSDVESCLEEYSDRGGTGDSHPRWHIVVAEAIFDDDGKLIEADGVDAATE